MTENDEGGKEKKIEKEGLESNQEEGKGKHCKFLGALLNISHFKARIVLFRNIFSFEFTFSVFPFFICTF